MSDVAAQAMDISTNSSEYRVFSHAQSWRERGIHRGSKSRPTGQACQIESQQQRQMHSDVNGYQWPHDTQTRSFITLNLDYEIVYTLHSPLIAPLHVHSGPAFPAREAGQVRLVATILGAIGPFDRILLHGSPVIESALRKRWLVTSLKLFYSHNRTSTHPRERIDRKRKVGMGNFQLERLIQSVVSKFIWPDKE